MGLNRSESPRSCPAAYCGSPGRREIKGTTVALCPTFQHGGRRHPACVHRPARRTLGSRYRGGSNCPSGRAIESAESVARRTSQTHSLAPALGYRNEREYLKKRSKTREIRDVVGEEPPYAIDLHRGY